MANNIKHPLAVGTLVKFLEPRCKCKNPPWTVKEGKITIVTKRAKGEYTYGISSSKKRIPSNAIVEVL